MLNAKCEMPKRRDISTHSAFSIQHSALTRSIPQRSGAAELVECDGMRVARNVEREHFRRERHVDVDIREAKRQVGDEVKSV